ATHAGYLVLNDAFYPGWKAYVDGHEVEILRANSIFRAVAVAADANEVRFEYAPESFKVGLAVSSATAGGLFFMAIVVFRKGRHSDGQVEPDSLHST
ncbi:MAG: YfhO family protein, partial [bacterium]|nr:YfhO family protein [bacterium]